ncbi:MAG: sensor histidine kinase [Bryobacteraceae bacterium]|nr:sensor histidine kinase [Bryobacteraceae bacterium]
MVLFSPTSRSLVGLAVTLLAVGLFSWYALRQVEGLSDLQTRIIDRNRRDSLQLLRIQNNLQNLGFSMRDMTTRTAGYPVAAWKAEFERTRFDLDDAFRIEHELGPTSRSDQQQQFLEDSVSQFWAAAERAFQLSGEGREEQAQALVRDILQTRHASIAGTVARFLVMNNEAEQKAAAEVRAIYSNVERNIYYFLLAAVVVICGTSVSLILQNRRVFRSLDQLSHQRQVLARKLITMQEDMFRSIARELHDEFGQVLTAVGALLARAQKPETSTEKLAKSLRETQQIVQEALDGVRSLSVRLHPNVLDDYGLEGAVEWYVRHISEQTGLNIECVKEGDFAGVVPPETAIHVYRILQESINNVVRHSDSKRAWVRLRRNARKLELEIEDRGVGLPEDPRTAEGLGLVGMRERAELIRGSLTFSRPAEGGTLVRLEAPLTA